MSSPRPTAAAESPGRVLETREMVGSLRSAHQHRYELPLLSAPAQMAPREVPLDPYALGLLLGDGCITGKTTPTFATADPELADALEEALDGIELKPKGGYDYVLRHVHGHRGGVIVANPVTAALRELGLSGRGRTTKFVPEVYLHNEPGGSPRRASGAARQRRRPRRPARPHLPHPVRHLLRAAARRRRLPRALAWRRRILPRAGGRGPGARAARTVGPCTTEPTPS